MQTLSSKNKDFKNFYDRINDLIPPKILGDVSNGIRKYKIDAYEVKTEYSYWMEDVLKIVNDYVPYKAPVKLFFNISSNIYDIKQGGWVLNVEESLIIGETKDSYVTKLLKSVSCDTDDSHYGEEIIIPIGIHKSRLIKTTPGQTMIIF